VTPAPNGGRGPTASDREVWFLTGSQDLYGDDTLARVAEQSAEVVAGIDSAPEVPVPVVAKPVLTTADAIRRVCLEADAEDRCVGVVTWMHTFSPARMWIGGLRALHKPLAHLHTQHDLALPWAEIDMDFMNLNQSAHGDREFGYLATRLRAARATVVGHWGDPAVHRRVGAWARAALGWHEAQRLRVARFGDNMRWVAVTEGDKVEAQIRLGVAVNGYGVSELADRVDLMAPSDIDDLVSTTWSSCTATPTPSSPSCAPAATGTPRCATPRPSSSPCAASSTRSGPGPSPTRSRTWPASASCPASPSSG
jgi:L-arabinose isomerase